MTKSTAKKMLYEAARRYKKSRGIKSYWSLQYDYEFQQALRQVWEEGRLTQDEVNEILWNVFEETEC